MKAAPTDKQASRFHGLALMLRGRVGLTQRQLAASIGVSERAVQVWEAGLGFPSARSLQRLIALYLIRRVFSAGHEAAEAAALWGAALEEGPRFKAAFDTEWFAALPVATPPIAPATTPIGEPTSQQPGPRRADWGEAPSVSRFHGRTSERDALTRWLLVDRCRLVGVLGMGGIGKTALVASIAQQLAPHFDAVFWRSMRNAPACTDWLAGAILFLSEHRTVPSDGEEARRRLLLDLLRERRCLLVLDNMETLLEPGASAERYRDGYAGYGLVLQSLAEVSHQSCLLMTTREEPPALGRLEGQHAPVRMLRLGGLDEQTGRMLLAAKGLVGDDSMWSALVSLYRGNALALQLVGETIATVFGGDINAFLSTGEAVFGDIRRLLQSQIARLSATERAALYWLAVEREPVDFHTLVSDLGPGTPGHETLEALEALGRRSLLELGDRATFTLQPVVLEHAAEELVSAGCAEIKNGKPELLLSHALVKANGKEYVRHSQERLLAAPLLERLAATWPDAAVEQRLVELLEQWRGRPHAEQGYGPANVVALLRLTHGHLRGLDLSRLSLRQVDFSAVEVQDTSLANARLDQSVVAQQFGAAASTALSADGSAIAVGTVTGEIRVWRLADRTLMLAVEKPTGPAWDVSLSADGQCVASCGGESTVCVWRTDSGRVPMVLESGTGELWRVALSADGRVAAGGAGDGTTHLWDARTGQYLRVLECHKGGVRGLSLSADGRILASGGADGTVRVWDTRTGLRLSEVNGHIGEARAVALSSDGRILASSGGEGVVRVSDAHSGECKATLEGQSGPVWGLALSEDGKLLASGGADRTVRLWNTNTSQCQLLLHDHAAGVMTVALSADGQLVAAGALDGTVRLWESRGGQCLGVSTGHVAAVFDVALSADGRRAASGGGDGRVRLWDTTDGRCLRVFQGHTAGAWAVAISADGELVASGGLDATVRLWSVRKGECRAVLHGHTTGVVSVSLSADGQLAASGSLDGGLRLWDTRSGACLRTQQCDVAGVRTVRLSANGQVLVSGELNGTVRVWDTRSGECLSLLASDATEVRGAALSADGRLLACGEPGGRVRLWKTGSGECLRVLQGATAGVRGVALSANGEIVAVGGVDGSVRLWGVGDGRTRAVLHGHSTEVWGMALSADGRLAASSSPDGTVRLWDTCGSGTELRTMRPDRPYERMDITGISGVTDAQRTALLSLGAVEQAG